MTESCRPYRLVGFAAFLLLGIGCSGKGDVSGHVTRKGEPVTGGWILIWGADGLGHRGQIQKDGSYLVKDVPTGEAKVGVSVAPINPKQEGATARRPTMPKKGASGRRPKLLADPLESGLMLTIKRGQNVFDIEVDRGD